MRSAEAVSAFHPRGEVHLAELGSAWLGILAGIALTILRATAGEPYDRAPLAILAFGAVYALPGVLALLARKGRPVLYLASGVIYLPLAVTSLAGVTLPLVIPAVMASVAYVRHIGEAKPRLFGGIVAVGIVALGIAAFLTLFLSQDPRCIQTLSSSSCTSDIVTNTEGLLSLGMAGSALGAGWSLAAPRS